jgi:hypothetical protein
MEYLENVRRLETAGTPFDPGSDQEEAAIERFQSLLRDFKAPNFRQEIESVYASDVFFNDTLKTIRGSAELEEYLGDTADSLDVGTVEFQDVVSSSGNYYFRWRMTLRSNKLAGGRETTSVGMSHIRFNDEGKVALHQDFWDSTGGLFEHIPGLGWMIRSVKRRL